MKKLKMLMWFLLIGFAGYSDANAASWYVDKDATGSNIGTSWANAWTSFSSINWGGDGVAPGDTVYISGGSTSKTYNATLTVGRSGSIGNPITIKTGQDTGHTGTVIIDGQNSLIYGINVPYSYVTVNGGYNGSINLEVKNFVENAIRSRGVTGNKFLYMNIHDIGNRTSCSSYAVTISGKLNEVAYSYIHDVSREGSVLDHDTTLALSGFGEAGSYHHNTTENIPEDHIMINQGWDIYNNTFDQNRNSTTVPGCAGSYTDLIHSLGGTHRVYNNNFLIRNVEGGGNAMVFMEVFGVWGNGRPVYRSNIQIYNNLFHHTDPNYSGSRNIQGVMLKWHDSNADAYGYTNTWDNVYVYNNTFVDHPYGPLLTNNFPAGMQPRHWEIKNNIFVNSGTRTGAGGNAIVIENGNYSASDVVIDGNVINAGSAGGAGISFRGSRYATPAAYNSAFGRNNRGCIPSFISYYPGTYAGRNLRLQPSDSCALNFGLPLNLVDTDMDGVSRPKFDVWDIGAYESATVTQKIPMPPTGIEIK